MVALLPPETIGAERHARAVNWLVGKSGEESDPLFRWRDLVVTGRLPKGPQPGGWPWFSGTAAWVTPTCLSILALKKCYWRKPSPVLRERIDKAQMFLLAHRCADGGWNHGSAKALGYDSDSYRRRPGKRCWL